MHWSDLALRFVQALGALVSALAGIAALLTDGAFEKRQQPLEGWWKGSPIAKYRITSWGGTLLAVILIAPMVQLVGDWMKDSADTKALHATAEDISQDIDRTVTESTTKARDSVTALLASTTNNALTEIDRTLYPFKDVAWAYEIRLNLDNPALRQYRDFLRKTANDIQTKYSDVANDNQEHNIFDEAYPNTVLYSRPDQRTRIIMFIDSPLIPNGVTNRDAYNTILDSSIRIDIFKNTPSTTQLSHLDFISNAYSLWMDPPFSNDIYQLDKQGSGFPVDNNREFQLIYFPPLSGKPTSDECYVDYYWHAMSKQVPDKPESISILGLPDLAGALFVVRLNTDGSGKDPLCFLESIRMRVGIHELSLTKADFTSTAMNDGMLLYRKEMPKQFEELRKLFTIVRSDWDTAPVSTSVEF